MILHTSMAMTHCTFCQQLYVIYVKAAPNVTKAAYTICMHIHTCSSQPHNTLFCIPVLPHATLPLVQHSPDASCFQNPLPSCTATHKHRHVPNARPGACKSCHKAMQASCSRSLAGWALKYQIAYGRPNIATHAAIFLQRSAPDQGGHRANNSRQQALAMRCL